MVLGALALLGAVGAAEASHHAVGESPEPRLSLDPRSATGDLSTSSYTLLGATDTLALSADDEARPLGRDWSGIATDTAWFVGYELTFMGITAALPSDISGLHEGTAFETWWRHVSNPHWDHDQWVLNYITHPYWGAAYYTRARERGFGVLGSFLYATLLSTMFEYGAEALFEPPSYQDLIITPIAGALIGALVFEPIRARIKAKPEFQWHDRVIMVATDPLGGINAVAEWLFGIKSEVQLQFRPPASMGLGGPTADASTLGGARADSRRRLSDVGVWFVMRF